MAKAIRKEWEMILKRFVAMVLSMMPICGVFAQTMEDFGGFKARNYETRNGKTYTSGGTEVKNYMTDLTATERETYIEAAKMASAGYADSRYDDYKTLRYGDGKTTGYEEVGEKALVNILNKASEIARSEGRGTELHINKTTKIKGSKSDEKALMICGNGETRLNARVFVKTVDGKQTIGLVFGGTYGIRDGIDDVQNILPFTPTPKAYKEAAELLKAVKAAYPNADINVYGHSEGGGEAMYAVLSEGVHNGDGIVKCYGVNSAGLNGLKTTDVIIKGEKITKEEIAQNFVLIQNEGERLGGVLKIAEVSSKAYQFGTVIFIPDMGDVFGLDEEGKETENTFHKGLDPNKKVKKNLDKAHDVVETLWKMTHCQAANKEEDKVTTTQKEDVDNPFNSNPEPEPDPPTSTTPVHSNTTQVRPSSPTHVRRGGGGDTSAIIWKKK